MLDSPSRPTSLVRLASVLALATALLLVVAKFFTWLATGSVAVLGSLVDSVIDAVASGVNFFAIRQSLVPADRDHRFGHGKLEALAGLAQASFVGGSAVFLFMESIERFVHPRDIAHGWIGIAVMLGSLTVTGLLVLFQRSVVRRTGSLAISADAFHYETDVVAYVAVIFALGLSTHQNLGWVDAVVGVGIAFYMLRGTFEIGRVAFDQLMDREIPDSIRNRIRDLALAQEGVESIHDLRTRMSGLQYIVQFHVALDGGLSLREAHELSDQVEKAITDVYPQVDIIVHQDPSDIVETVDFREP